MASYLLIWEYRSKCLKFPSKNRSIGFMSRFSQSHLEENVWLIFFPQGHCLKNLNALRESSAGMYTKTRLPDGRVRVTGGKRLKESGAYTPEFGKRVAQLFKKGAVAGCSKSVPILFSQYCHPYMPHHLDTTPDAKKSSSSPVRFQRRALLHSDSDLCGN